MDAYKLWKKSNKSYLKKHFFMAKLRHTLLRIVYSCEIPYSCNIGEGLVLPHNGLGVVINPKSRIGNNVTILQNVTIAGRSGKNPPTIGNNVLIGAGAIILGDIIVGDNAQIGAGAVVVHDVPPYAVVIGNPARIIKIINDDNKDKNEVQ